MKNKLIFCTENEILLNREFSKLLNLLVTGSSTNLSKEDKKNVNGARENYSIPDFLTCDPDYITFENLPELMGVVVSNLGHSPEITEYMKRVPFEKIDIGRKSYIITNFGLPESAQKMVSEFFAPNFKQNFTNRPGTWDHFYSLKNAIAFRGGSGYVYSIWDYSSIR